MPTLFAGSLDTGNIGHDEMITTFFDDAATPT
jgi:hypothetical protein